MEEDQGGGGEEEVKLLGEWSSPFVYRVIWALKLKGIKYKYIEHLSDPSKKSDLLLHYNPIHKKVPVLVHGGKPIVESMIIVEYIDETWPDKYPLLPKDPHKKFEARFWAKFIDDQGPIFWKFFSTVGEEQEKAIRDALEILKTIEEQGIIGDQQKFFGGGVAIGMMDIAFGWMAYWLVVMEDVVGVKLVESHAFPRLHSWMENFKQVPAIKENIYDHDAMVAHFKRLRKMFSSSSPTSS